MSPCVASLPPRSRGARSSTGKAALPCVFLSTSMRPSTASLMTAISAVCSSKEEFLAASARKGSRTRSARQRTEVTPTAYTSSFFWPLRLSTLPGCRKPTSLPGEGTLRMKRRTLAVRGPAMEGRPSSTAVRRPRPASAERRSSSLSVGSLAGWSSSAWSLTPFWISSALMAGILVQSAGLPAPSESLRGSWIRVNRCSTSEGRTRRVVVTSSW